MADSNFSVSGLITGMDTSSIVEKLVQLESQPITRLQKRESAYKSQVSTLASMASKLSALQTAARALSTNGVLGLKTTSTSTAFSAAPGSSATAGSYDVAVEALAKPAKMRMAAPGAGQTLRAGTITLTVNGTAYAAQIADGASLADIAYAIKTSGAPVSAVAFDDDGGGHLALTTTNTGYEGADPSSALQVSFAAAPGATGNTDPAFASTQTASNAVFEIDGLTFTRTSNVVTDALPGTTLTLKEPSKLDGAGAPIPETLTLANDVDATKAKLQAFVDAYNGVMQLIESQLSVTKDTDRGSTLAGDSTVVKLQQRLQALGTSKAFEQGTLRTLADLGLKTQTDGTLTIDSSVLSAAIGRDPGRANALFSDATAGISKLVASLVDDFTAPGTGLLTVRQSGLQSQIASLDDQVASMQERIATYRATLLSQFTAMEQIVSGYKSIGTYLTQLSARSSSS